MPFNPQRLKQLRLAQGLSLDMLAAHMGDVVTKAALSKYEQGRMAPSPRVLTKLASVLKVKAAFLNSESRYDVQFCAYRKHVRLAKKEEMRIENSIRRILEERIRLQEVTGQLQTCSLPIRSFAVSQPAEAEAAAEKLRGQWNLGADPIGSLTGVLEDNCVHVVEVDASDSFDGISAVAISEEDQTAKAAAVVTRSGVSGDRQRLNLAHELGHLVLAVDSSADQERLAFRFGSAFLAPAGALRNDIGRKRTMVTPMELFILKKKFRVSIQALVRRLRDLEVISDTHYRHWCIHINKSGWKKNEPAPIPREKPQWLRLTVLRGATEGLISSEEAANLLGGEWQRHESLALIRKREVGKLTPIERQRLLRSQAQELASWYEEDPEWKEFESAELATEQQP